jgi:hypothetical protein
MNHLPHSAHWKLLKIAQQGLVLHLITHLFHTSVPWMFETCIKKRLTLIRTFGYFDSEQTDRQPRQVTVGCNLCEAVNAGLFEMDLF